MATEVHKFDGQQWRAITEIQYTDGSTDRDITEVHKNDGGTWRQVFGASVSPQVPAWASSSPSDDYKALGTEGITGSVTFSADTSGNFSFAFDETERVGSTGDPTFGTYKPIIEVDAVNYEISISFAGGNVVAVGSGTIINGTFQDLDTTRGIKLEQVGAGSTASTISIEIRDKVTPANTTGVATFVMDVFVTS